MSERDEAKDTQESDDTKADETKDQKADERQAKVEFSEEQTREVARLVAKESRAAREKALADAKAAQEQAKEAERVERERKAQAERGEFDAVKADIERERDDAKAERDDFKAKYERAATILDAHVTAQWADLPTEVAALYEGADDDPLAKAAYLAKPATAALVARLTPDAQRRGNGANPQRRGPAEHTVDDEKRALARRGAYSM